MNSWSKIPQIIKQLEDGQEKKLDLAAKHMKAAIKAKISKKGVSNPGDAPGKDIGKSYRQIGFGHPAQHAHLLEFGTVPRTVKNYMGKAGKVVAVGRVIPRPFMRPVFEEEAGNVEKILSGEWVA
jgi:hypothetical protein